MQCATIRIKYNLSKSAIKLIKILKLQNFTIEKMQFQARLLFKIYQILQYFEVPYASIIC